MMCVRQTRDYVRWDRSRRTPDAAQMQMIRTPIHAPLTPLLEELFTDECVRLTHARIWYKLLLRELPPYDPELGNKGKGYRTQSIEDFATFDATHRLSFDDSAP